MTSRAVVLGDVACVCAN